MKKLYVLCLSLLMVSAAGCGKEGETSKTSKNSNNPSTPITQGLAVGTKGDVVAEVNGQAITEKELMEKIKPRLARIESQLFDLKEDGIDQIIQERLLDAEAGKRKATVPELLKSEVQDKITEPSDKEVEDFYNELKKNPRFNNQPLDQIKGQIVGQLKSKQANTFRDRFIGKLMDESKIEIYLAKPRVEVGVGKSPGKGPANAPVTIIEFTDFQCPYCAKARPIVNEIVEQYKDKVHYVVRNFPLNFHKLAQKSAEAALCANDQKKYWEYSNKLWDNQRALEVDNLKKYAQETGLNTSKFNECLDSGSKAAEVQSDLQDGVKAGVSGTPAFFINGIGMSGAQSSQAFSKIIDQELRKSK